MIKTTLKAIGIGALVAYTLFWYAAMAALPFLIFREINLLTGWF